MILVKGSHTPTAPCVAELDAYLERGWFREGDHLITYDFVDVGGQVRSVVWTRLDLRTYRPRRSFRKLLAANGRRFRVSIGAFVIDDAPRDALRPLPAQVAWAPIQNVERFHRKR